MSREQDFDVFFIDMNRLDEQIAEHTFLFIAYSKKLKKAKRELVQLKTEQDFIIAEIGLKIVKFPKRFKLPPKPTKDMITWTTIKKPKYKSIQSKINKQQSIVNALQIQVAAFEHRKRMLTEANILHGKEYFSTPYVPESSNRMVIEQLKKQRARRKTQGKKKK